MAVTLGTVATFKSTNGAYPWSFTSTATIDTSTAVALLVFISSSGNNHVSPTITYQGTAMTVIARIPVPATSTQGFIWAFGLLAPAQTATGSITVSENNNGDGSNMVVIPITSCNTSTPWGTTASVTGAGSTISQSLVTTAANSLVVSCPSTAPIPRAGPPRALLVPLP
jgi:hypothetical protein